MTCDVTQEEEELTVDAIPVVYSLLSIFASCVMLVHFKKAREASKEYAEAKSVLDDIVLSFKSEIRALQDRVAEISLKVEKVSPQDIHILEDLRLKILDLATRVDNLARAEETLAREHIELKKSVDNLSSQRGTVPEKTQRLDSIWEDRQASGSEAIDTRMSVRGGGAPVPLTETELKVLEILASEGEKTAPQVRDRIGLTREHTARLMKSLYVRGYVERDKGKVPYAYRLNRDMARAVREQGKGYSFFS